MIENLIQYDKELFLFLNNLGSESWDFLWLLITSRWFFTPMYAVLLFIIYKKFGLKALLVFVVSIVLMITFTDQMTNVFKRGFMRFRPCNTEGVMEYMRFVTDHCGRYSFFSGHSSNSMAAAIFGGLLLRPYYKKLIYLLVFWSFLVAYSRIYVGVHFPIDIVCGLVFGVFAGCIFYKISQYAVKRFAN